MAYQQAAALWHKTAGILRGELSRCQEAFEKHQEKLRREKAARERERKQQEVVLAIKDKWGKNAILRDMNFSEGATARDRNQQVGGHKA